MAKRRKKQEPEIVRRDGVLCAAFVNTASRNRKPLRGYAHLLTWGELCGVVSSTDVQRLERAAGERPAEAEAVWQRAQRLRASLGRILLALAAGQPLPAGDVGALNTDLAPVLSARQLVPAAGGYRWAWSDRGGNDLDRVLWFVLLSAADVLTSKDHRRVRRCAGEGCDLLFVDRAPGSPRKWCSMKSCGHRVNARKHYHAKVKPRKKEAREQVRAEEKAQARERARKRAQAAGSDDLSDEGLTF